MELDGLLASVRCNRWRGIGREHGKSPRLYQPFLNLPMYCSTSILSHLVITCSL